MELEFDATTSACDLRIAGWDKGTNITNFLKEIKISPRQVIYIGDSNSDIDGMKTVKYAASPSNAARKVREYIRKNHKTSFLSEKEYESGARDIWESFIKKLSLELVITDVDGVIYQRDYTDEKNAKKFAADFISGCTGPRTSRPLVTICTGRSYKDSEEIIKRYSLNRKGIPLEFYDIWPELLFENGTIRVNPITEEIRNIMGNENEELISSLKERISPEINKLKGEYGRYALIENKITMVTIKIPPAVRRTEEGKIYVERIKEIFENACKEENVEFSAI